MADPGSDNEFKLQAAPPFSRERARIGRLPLDRVSFDEAVAWTLDFINHRGNRSPARISCPNASLIVLAQQNAGFTSIVSSCDLVVADGKPLLWAASLLGTPLCGQIRGVDLMERICAAGAAHRLTFYILGALPGAAKITAVRLRTRYAGLQLAGTDCPSFGFESDAGANRQVRDRIIAAAPDFLIVALGSPKQEWWIYRNYRDLPVGAILGVGAAVDTYAGLRPRPPEWMGKVGLEWLGRLLSEPRRLWRRYLFGNTYFLYIIARQLLRRGKP